MDKSVNHVREHKLPGFGPVDRLVQEVRAAMREYDASGDHKHQKGGPFPGDCLRCALRAFEEKVKNV